MALHTKRLIPSDRAFCMADSPVGSDRGLGQFELTSHIKYILDNITFFELSCK